MAFLIEIEAGQANQAVAEIAAKVDSLAAKLNKASDKSDQLSKTFAPAAYAAAVENFKKLGIQVGLFAGSSKTMLDSVNELAGALKNNYNKALVEATRLADLANAATKTHIDMNRDAIKIVSDMARETNRLSESRKQFNRETELQNALNRAWLVEAKKQVSLQAQLNPDEQTRKLREQNEKLKIKADLLKKLNAVTAESRALTSQATQATIIATESERLGNLQKQARLNAIAKLDAATRGLINITEKEARVLKLVRDRNISYADALAQVTREVREAERAEIARNQAVTRGSTALSVMGGGLRGMGGIMAGMGVATLGVSAAMYALVRVTKEMIKVGAEFESNMVRAFAVMDVDPLSDTAQRMTDTVRELASTTVISVDEAAKAMATLGMAGLTAEESIVALKPALDIAVIGMISMEKSADIVTSIMAAFHLKASDMVDVVDDMATASTSSKLTIEQLGTSMSYAAPVAAGLGVDMQSLIASLEALHNAGIKSSRAGVAMRRIMLSLYAPTRKGAAALDDMGVSITNAVGESRPFLDIIYDMREAMDEGSTSTGRLKDVVGLKMVGALINVLDAANDTTKGLLSMKEALNGNAGAAEELSNKIQATTTGKFLIMKSAFADLGVEIFNSTNGFMDSVLTMTTSAVNGLKELVAEFSEFSVAKHNEEVLKEMDGFWAGLGRLALTALDAYVFATKKIKETIFDVAVYLTDQVVGLTNKFYEFIGIDYRVVTVKVRLMTAEFDALKETIKDFDMNNLTTAQEKVVEEFIAAKKALEDYGVQVDMTDLDKQKGDWLGQAQAIALAKSDLQAFADAYEAYRGIISSAFADPAVAWREDAEAARALIDKQNTLIETTKLLGEKQAEMNNAVNTGMPVAEYSKLGEEIRQLERKVNLYALAIKDQEEVMKKGAEATVNLQKAALEEADALGVQLKVRKDFNDSLEETKTPMKRLVGLDKELKTVGEKLLWMEGKYGDALFESSTELKKYNDLRDREKTLQTKKEQLQKSINDKELKAASTRKKLNKLIDDANDLGRESNTITGKELSLAGRRKASEIARNRILKELKGLESVLLDKGRLDASQTERLTQLKSDLSAVTRDINGIKKEENELDKVALKNYKDAEKFTEALNAVKIIELDQAVASVSLDEQKAIKMRELNQLMRDKKALLDSVNPQEAITNEQKRELRRIQKDVNASSREYNSIVKKQADAMDAMLASLNPLDAATKQYNDDMVILNKLLSDGAITYDQYAIATSNAKYELDLLAAGDNQFTKTLVEWTNGIRDIDKVAAGWLNNFSTALADFLKTGKLDFKNFVDGIINDLATLAARQITVSIVGVISGVSGGVGGLVSGIGSLFGGGGDGGISQGGEFDSGSSGFDLSSLASLFGSTGSTTFLGDTFGAMGGLFSTQVITPAAPMAYTSGGLTTMLPGGATVGSSAGLIGGSAMGFGLAGLGGGLIGSWLGSDQYGAGAGAIGGIAGYGLASGIASGALTSVVSGLTSGALSGAAVGSIVPVIGTIIGAVLGAVLSNVFGDDGSNSVLSVGGGDGGIAPAGTVRSGRRVVGTDLGRDLFDRQGNVSGTVVDAGLGTLFARGLHIGNADDQQIPQEDFNQWMEGMQNFFAAVDAVDTTIIDTFDLSDEQVTRIRAATEGLGTRTENMAAPDLDGFFRTRYGIIFDEIGGLAGSMFDSIRDDLDPDNILREMANLVVVFAQVTDVTAGLVDHYGLTAEAIERITDAAQDLEGDNIGEVVVGQFRNVFAEVGGLANKLFTNFANEGLDESSTLDAITAVLTMEQVLVNLGNTAEDAAQILAEADMSQTDRLVRQRNAVYDLISAYDGTLQSTKDLSAGLEEQRQGTLALLVAIAQTKDAIGGTIKDQIDKLSLENMTDQQKIGLYTDKLIDIRSALRVAQDPAEVLKLTNDFMKFSEALRNLEISQGRTIFDRRTQELRAAGYDTALREQLGYDTTTRNQAAQQRLRDLDRLAQQRLDDLAEAATTEAERMAAAVEDAINNSFVPVAEGIEESTRTAVSSQQSFAQATQVFVAGVGSFSSNITDFGEYAQEMAARQQVSP